MNEHLSRTEESDKDADAVELFYRLRYPVAFAKRKANLRPESCGESFAGMENALPRHL